MGDMLNVVCGRCGQTFEASDEDAETGGVCPFCGADAGDDAPEPIVEFSPAPDAERHAKPPPGIPSPLWWLAAILIVAAFLAAIVFMLRGDSWEQQHLQQLADSEKKAAAFMLSGDYRQAENEFQSIVEQLNGREIQSIYLRELLDRARQGAGEARHQLALAATRPAPIAAAAATAPSAPETGGIPQSAIIDFQRRAESFPQFTRAHPFLFQDSHGSWRRRQFLVWDVDAELQTPGDESQIFLKYSCNSRTTAAHDLKEDAQKDGDFLFDEHLQAIQCQSRYEYRAGGWSAIQPDSNLQAQDNTAIRDGTVQPESILDLTDLRQLEAEHFAGASAAR
jgi:hypothetical protein